MTSGSLYDRPDLYDLMAPRDPALELFYLNQARTGNGSVLDLACGSGRLSLPLAQAGHQVVGGDASAPMLGRARDAAIAADLDIAFVELDMRDFDLGGRRFDTIIVAANAFLHLLGADEQRGFLLSVRNHLAPEGQLVFDIFVPGLEILTRDPNRRYDVGTVQHPEHGTVRVDETHRYDPIDQVSNVIWFWSTATQPDFWVTPFRLRQIFPRELPLILELGGMRLCDRFGGFDRSPFSEESWRQVCVCEAL